MLSRRPLRPILIRATAALQYPKHSLLICAAFILYFLPASAFGADAAVTVVSLTFSPADVTINVGDKVTWTGLQFGVGHTVSQTPDASANVYVSGFRSGNQNAVPTFEWTFNTAGTFFYICEPHATIGMKGSVTVQAVEVGDPDNLFVDFGALSNGVGTEGSPLDNLGDAVAAANQNGTINLKSGSSPETFTAGQVISKALTLLNNTPGGGSVIIGAPPARSENRSGFRSRSVAPISSPSAAP